MEQSSDAPVPYSAEFSHTVECERMSDKVPIERLPGEHAARRITQTIVDFIAQVPQTPESRGENPGRRARALASAAAARAALAAGTLALPGGPLGVLTILPELTTVWRLQAQLVADIAGAFGRDGALTREQMLYCLFRHTAAQAVRDLAVRVGERVLVRSVPLPVIHSAACEVGMHVVRRTLREGVARWLPVVGAFGVGAYAYYDTQRVASTAVALFECDLDVAVASFDAPDR